MIDIEKLADENGGYRLTDQSTQFTFTTDDLKQFAESYAAKVLEDKEREVAELKEKLTTELKRGGSYKLLVSSLEGQLEHYRSQDYTLAKARLDTLEQSLNSEREMNEILTNENTELQAYINDLRETLEEIIKYTPETFWQNKAAQQALSKTPAQSLQQFENEVIESCAKVLDERKLTGTAEAIRALKVTNE